MFKKALTVTAASALVAAAALGTVYGVIGSTQPTPQPDSSALVAAEQRAQDAENRALAAEEALADSQATAQYTACMYALNTLNPRSDMQDAAWSCARNVSGFRVLTPGEAW